MTDQEQFTNMLQSRGVEVRQRTEFVDDNPNDPCIVVEIWGGDIVNTFSHCFCEFIFDTEGKLSGIKYGY